MKTFYPKKSSLHLIHQRLNLKKITPLFFILTFLSFSSYGQAGSATATYTSGDIPTDVSSAMSCAAATGSLTVTIPSGKIVTSVDVAYDMTAASGAWQGEQRSRIRVTNNGNEESFVSGSGNSEGTFSYSRTITLADDLTSTSITFELDAYRTYGPGFTPSGCNTTYNKVDDGTWTVTVNYDDAPSCLAPTGLASSNITATSVQLDWNSEATATSGYDWVIMASGDDPDVDTPVDSANGVTGTSVTSTALSALTDYDAYVRSDCGGSGKSTWSVVESFSTLGDCSSTGSFDYVDNSDSSNSVGFIANTPGDYITLEFTAGSTEACCDDWFITDAADGSGNTIATGSGSIVGSYESTTGEISFYVDSDGSVQGTTFTYELSCAPPPSCLTPANFAVSNITASGADLDWDSEATATSGYDWVIMASGDDPDVDTPVDSANGVMGTSVSSSGLSANTPYDAYVRSDCGGSGQSDWSAVESFTTPCAVFTPDYLEDFSTFVPNCWEEATDGNPTTGPTGLGSGSWGSDGFANNGSSGAADINLYTTGKSDWLISPEFDLSAGGFEVLFDVALTDFASSNSSPMGSDDEVQFLYTDDGGTTWNNLKTWAAGTEPSETGDLEIIDLSSITGTNVQFAFWATEGSTDDSEDVEFFVDNFEVRTPPSCITPTGLASSNITATSVQLDWNSEVTATSGYDWVIMASGDDPDVDTPVDSANGVTGTSVTSTALSADTDYDAYVRSDCGGDGKSEWSDVESFTTLYNGQDCDIALSATVTPSGDTTQPLSFDTTDLPDAESVPSCEGSDSTEQGYWYEFSTNATNGVTLSLLSGNASDLEGVIYDACGGNEEFCFADASSKDFTEDVLVTGLSANTTYYLQVYTESFNEGSFSLAISDLPSCISPENLVASNITATSVQLDWTATTSTESGGYEYVLITDGSTPDATTTPTGSVGTGVTTANPSGLSSQTDYDAYVRAICSAGDESDWSALESFTTLCATESLPWTEDFENAGNTPNCWTESGGEAWKYDTSGAGENIGDLGTITGSTDSGNYFAWIDNSGADSPSTLTSPFVDLSSLTTPQVAFYVISDSGSDPNSTLDVDIYDGSSWTNVGSYSTDTNGWELKEIVLSSVTFTGDARVRFTITDGGGFRDDVAIDDVTFEEAPSCITPTGLASSNITATSVQLDWDSEATATSGYDWVIMASGDDPDVDTPVDSANGVTGTSVTSTALSAETDYDAYVRSDCGGSGKSDWSAVESFTTPCAVFTPDYLEDFSTFVPNCWEEATDGNPTTGPTGLGSGSWGSDGFANNGSSGAADINLYTTGKSDWLISPEFDLSAGGFEVLFDVALTDFASSNSSPMGSDDEVQFLYTDDGGTTWNNLKTWAAGTEPSETGDLEIIDLSSITGTNVQFAFWATEGSTDDSEDVEFFVDNFEVRTPPSCITPTGLASSNITATSVQLDWNSEVTATSGYDWVIMASGDDPDVDTPVDSANGVTGTSVTSTALSAETDYDAYVRSDCGGSGKSAWSAVESFSTPADFCAGDLATDSGGTTGDYPSGATETITICPNSSNDKVVINFSEFSFENNGTSCYDGLTIYDGDNTTTASTINPPTGTEWCWDRADVTPSGSGDLLNVSVAATTASGCLTLVLSSDGSVTREGFVASASCESTVYLWDGSSWTNEPVATINPNDNLYVNSGGSPSLSGIIGGVNDVYIDPGATLDVSSGYININGDLNNNGSITGSSDVIIDGAFTPTQSIKGTGSIDNLNIQSSLSAFIEGEQEITNMLSLNSGNLFINGSLTLKSNASGTAQIADLNGNIITGDVTVERFIPAGDNNRRVFRLLSSPVTTSTSIRDNWQEGALNNTDDPNPGFGTHITGSTTDTTNGFDGTNSGAASLLLFDNNTQTWSAIGNTDVNTIQAGEAYALFVRGDRSIDLTSSSQTPTNTVLRATGAVPAGSVDFTSDLSTGANQFNLIGNPYQAIVDFTSLTTSDIKTAFFFVWDPNGATSGQYVSYDGTPGEEMMLQPGQSIFVQNSVSATSPSLVFSQSDKNPSGAVTSVFDTNQIAIANLELYNMNNIEVDVMKFRFEDGADNGIDDYDAGKLGNPTENLASVNSGTLLSIERRDIPQADEVLPLFINQYQDAQYEFKLEVANWDDSINVYIVDNYLNTSTLIDANQGYSFSVDSSIPESVATDRFEINFDNTTLGVNDNSFGSNFNIYPNPTGDGLFTIKTSGLEGNDVNVKIHNMLGQEMLSREFNVENNGEVNVNASELASGIYMVELSQNDKHFTTKLIIK